MSRAITRRYAGPYLTSPPDAPGMVVEPIEFFNPAEGLHTNVPPTKITKGETPNFANSFQNFRLSTGWYKARPGLVQLGGVAAKPIIEAISFFTASGYQYLIRWTTVGVEVFDSGNWVALSGPVLALWAWSEISYTTWGERLMFTDQTSGLYEINFTGLTYALIPAAPICRQITVFGGHVVLSYVSETTGGLFATRIRWSVKNDNTDYSGLGSGYEDLISGPGSVVDAQIGVYPINDTTSIILRSGSVWQMSLTGYFDAPFEFQMLTSNIYFDAPRGVAVISGTPATSSSFAVPNGIVAVGRDDVYIITPSGPSPITEKIRNIFYAAGFLHTRTVAQWDSLNREVVIYTPLTGIDDESVVAVNGLSRVWRYNVDKKTWTYDVYKMTLKSIHQLSYRIGTTIDGLAGTTIDSLLGPIDSLGFQTVRRGLLLTSYGTSNGRFNAAEDSTALYDLNNVIAQVGLSLVVTTPPIIPTSPYEDVTVIEVQFEYTNSGQATAASISYSADGITFTSYGLATGLIVTDQPTIARVRSTLSRKSLIFRLSIDGGGPTTTNGVGFNLISLRAFCQAGAKINI